MSRPTTPCAGPRGCCHRSPADTHNARGRRGRMRRMLYPPRAGPVRGNFREAREGRDFFGTLYPPHPAPCTIWPVPYGEISEKARGVQIFGGPGGSNFGSPRPQLGRNSRTRRRLNFSGIHHFSTCPPFGWFVARACDFHSIGRSRVHFGGVSPGRLSLSFACWRSPRILARAKRPGGTCHRHAAANFIRRPRAAIEAFRADCLHRRHRLVPHRLELLAHHLARVATDEIFTVWFVA